MCDSKLDEGTSADSESKDTQIFTLIRNLDALLAEYKISEEVYEIALEALFRDVKDTEGFPDLNSDKY